MSSLDIFVTSNDLTAGRDSPACIACTTIHVASLGNIYGFDFSNPALFSAYPPICHVALPYRQHLPSSVLELITTFFDVSKWFSFYFLYHF